MNADRLRELEAIVRRQLEPSPGQRAQIRDRVLRYSEVMDMSFANQFMSQLRLVNLHKHGKRLENTVHDIPVEQDQEIASVKLAAMGFNIDKLSADQKKYIEDYSAGT